MTTGTFPTRRSFFQGSAGAAVAVACLAAPRTGNASEGGGFTAEERARHIDVVRAFFELMHRKEIDAWSELWAERGRIIVPYPPEGFGTSIDGKAEILRAFRGLFGNFESFDYELTGLYPAADSDAVCVEYNVRATIVGGTEYTNSNIAVFRFEAGLISAYHDYFDPRRFQTVVNALPKP